MPDRVRHLGRGSGSDLTPRRGQARGGRQAAEGRKRGAARSQRGWSGAQGARLCRPGWCVRAAVSRGSVARACAQPCCVQGQWSSSPRGQGGGLAGVHMRGGRLPLAAVSQTSNAPGPRPRGPASQQAWLGRATLPAAARGRGEGSLQAGRKREGGSQAF